MQCILHKEQGAVAKLLSEKTYTKPGTFSGPKRLKKGSEFLFLHYFFVQVAIAFLFCNSPFLSEKTKQTGFQNEDARKGRMRCLLFHQLCNAVCCVLNGMIVIYLPDPLTPVICLDGLGIFSGIFQQGVAGPAFFVSQRIVLSFTSIHHRWIIILNCERLVNN